MSDFIKLPESQRRLLVTAELLAFLADASGVDINSIHLQTDIVNDLRMTGDDAGEILEFLNKRFGTVFYGLDFGKTFGNEGMGCLQGIIVMSLSIVFGFFIVSFFAFFPVSLLCLPIFVFAILIKRSAPKPSATVSQLIDAAVAGEWRDETVGTSALAGSANNSPDQARRQGLRQISAWWFKRWYGGDNSCKIKPVKKLTTYDDYANATVFQYNDGTQRFYFDAAFRTIEIGTPTKPYTYAVVITLLGKTDPGGTVRRPVAYVDEVKVNIAEFFEAHCLKPAETPAKHVMFE